MDVEKLLATLLVIATIFKAVTSATKDISDIQATKQNKRRSPAKKKRRK